MPQNQQKPGITIHYSTTDKRHYGTIFHSRKNPIALRCVIQQQTNGTSVPFIFLSRKNKQTQHYRTFFQANKWHYGTIHIPQQETKTSITVRSSKRTNDITVLYSTAEKTQHYRTLFHSGHTALRHYLYSTAEKNPYQHYRTFFHANIRHYGTVFHSRKKHSITVRYSTAGKRHYGIIFHSRKQQRPSVALLKATNAEHSHCFVQSILKSVHF